MKHLTYQTLFALWGKGWVHIDHIPDLITNKHENNEYFNNDNIKKRIYDILNTLYESGFLEIKQLRNRHGKPQKKNRSYRINPEWAQKECIHDIHFIRY